MPSFDAGNGVDGYPVAIGCQREAWDPQPVAPFQGLPLSRPREPREPGTGANAGRLSRPARDAFRALSQVRGSPVDSFRPGRDGPFVAGGQGVAGSNPAVPTGQRYFSFIGSGANSGANGFPGAGLSHLGGARLQDAVHGRGVIGEGGPDLVPVDRLGDRRAAVPRPGH